MITALANPARFMTVSRPLAPALGGLSLVLFAVGLWLSFSAPEDYQQGDTVRIMFVHVPAAWMGLFAYAVLGGASWSGWSGATPWPTSPPRPRPRSAPASPCWPWSPARCGVGPCGGPGGCGTRG
jgi:hypothetical protein